MPDRKPPTAALMIGAAIHELSAGPDGLEAILAAHGPEADAAALLVRCMSKIASVLIAAPDLRVPVTVMLSPHGDIAAAVHIVLPAVQTIGEASAAVIQWTIELGGTPDNMRLNEGQRVHNFATLPDSLGRRAYIACEYSDYSAPMPEIECADCRGTGEQRDGSPCADCLGKGRVAAPLIDVTETCGDCVEGRCHWGGELSRRGVAAVEADPLSDPRPCGCARHEVSYRYRVQQAAARG